MISPFYLVEEIPDFWRVRWVEDMPEGTGENWARSSLRENITAWKESSKTFWAGWGTITLK